MSQLLAFLFVFTLSSQVYASEENTPSKNDYCLVETDLEGRKFLPGAIITKTPWKNRRACLRRQCTNEQCTEYQFTETIYFFSYINRNQLASDWAAQHTVLGKKKYPVRSAKELEEIKDEIFSQKITFSDHHLDYSPLDYTRGSLHICIFVPPLIAFALVADILRTVTYPVVNPAVYYYKNSTIRRAIRRLSKGKGSEIPDSAYGLIKKDVIKSAQN